MNIQCFSQDVIACIANNLNFSFRQKVYLLNGIDFNFDGVTDLDT